MSKNIIKRGSRGALVKEAQSVLSVIYPELKVDGIFGLQTQNVVKKFQASRKLVADGIIGPMTWGEMYQGEAPINYKPTEPKPIEVKPGSPLYDLSVTMKTKGSRPKGLLGLVVHFTAGWSTEGDRNMIDTLNWGIESGYTFWGISRTGKIFKTHDEKKWGSHAGTSYWPGLGNNVSQHLLGIEIANAGRVTKVKDGRYKAYFSEFYTEDMVRHSKANANIKAGTYLKFSDEQFESLVQICFDLKRKHETFSFDYVLGHDEVAPDRKDDPGASMPMTMPEFREYLKARWAQELDSKAMGMKQQE